MNWFDPLPTRGGRIPFALDASGRWLDVSQVKRGKACGCVCPDCRGPLIARKGEVLVHHFAHADQRECRHALEASFFGMTVEHLSHPGARLALPGNGRREHWVRMADVVLDPITHAKFFASPWIVDPTQADCADGFEANARSLHESTPSTPDLVSPTLKLAVHILSRRKKYEQVLDANTDPSWRVLALNLARYIKLWWTTCDPDRPALNAQPEFGRTHLSNWLANDNEGRGFLHDAELDARRERFDDWLQRYRERERQRRDDDQRLRKTEVARLAAETRQWTVPEIPGAPASARLFKAVRPDGDFVLTQWLATVLHLRADPTCREYIFVARPGQVVPLETRPYLDPDAPWSVFGESHSVQPAPGRSQCTREPKPEPPAAEDRIVDRGVGVCSLCGAPIDRVLPASGMWQGRMIERCSVKETHPFKVLGPAVP